jgi:AcrR family transcriptional regulator
MNDKKTLIVDAAIRLFSRDGVGVPTAKIAKEAGVSNGTLFNYFSTKQALIDGVCFSIAEKMAAEIFDDLDFNLDMEDIFFHVWKRYVYWAQRNLLRYRVLGLLKTSQIVSEDVLKRIDNFFAVIDETMAQGIKDKVIKDLPLDLLSEIACGQLDATISYIQANKLTKVEIDGLIQISFEIYSKGISL